MATSGERWKSYKTKGHVEEGRRRREEEGVQLRKLKRDEQVSTVTIPLAIYWIVNISSYACHEVVYNL